MKYYKVTYDNNNSVIYKGDGVKMAYWHEYIYKWVNSCFSQKALINQDGVLKVEELKDSEVFLEIL